MNRWRSGCSTQRDRDVGMDADTDVDDSSNYADGYEGLGGKSASGKEGVDGGGRRQKRMLHRWGIGASQSAKSICNAMRQRDNNSEVKCISHTTYTSAQA